MALFIGDILKPEGMGERVRFRVREIERVMESRPWSEPGPMIDQYVLQLFTQMAPGVWGWMDRSHDRRVTDTFFSEDRLTLVEKAQAQLSLF